LSKTDLAKKLGVNHSVIVRVEQAKGTSPRTAKAICDFFNLPFEELFTIVEQPSGR
jgi:DNA-binding XRE family transcriptional regulator